MDKGPKMKQLGWVLTVTGAVLLFVWGVSMGRTALSIRSHLADVSAWSEAPEDVDPAEACDVVTDVREDVVVVQRWAGGLIRLAPILGWLPAVGDELQAAPDLLVVADGLTEAGAVSCEAFGPALSGVAGDEADLSPERLVSLLSERQEAVTQALDGVERADAAWAEVDVSGFPEEIASRAALLDMGLPLLRSGLQAATAAPHLLGAEEPRTFLVLALNEDERRPIGGYITGVGEVTVEAGQVVTMTFGDVYDVDDFSMPYPEAPEPLQRYMGIDLLVFRDSNWSPDFPTTARRAISLYRPGHPVSVDGVIALDQYAVRRLVDALGPVRVPGSEERVTGDTVLAYMRQAWAPEEGELSREWWQQRKSFMEPLARAVWDQVGEGDVEWMVLGKTLLSLLEEKHLLAYVEDPAAADALARQGWDGALQQREGDFLMVVDANVGYNKASAKVRERIDYAVDLTASPPRANLTLVYTHTSDVDYPCEPEIRYDPVYEQMMDRCYWDYIRVYVPEGSELVDATRIPVPQEAVWVGEADSGEVTVSGAEEGPWVNFGVLGLIPPSTTQTRTFEWTLPPDVVEWADGGGRYALLVQKQPGTQGHLLSVRVRLPEGIRVVDAEPEPSSIEDGWVVYETALHEDMTFDLEFEEGQ